MSVIDRYLARGWRLLNSSKGAGRIKCPHNCGLILTVSTQAKKTSINASAIKSAADLSLAITKRRQDLGLISDDVDDAAGLGSRHTQKVEDLSRRSLSNHNNESLLHMAATAIESNDPRLKSEFLKAAAKRNSFKGRRSPTIDTILLMTAALGGELQIVWGEPPNITKSYMQK